ncbi:MAG: ADP-glyceromanno-heptose 6-epimerase [Kiloniellales bacterium]
MYVITGGAGFIGSNLAAALDEAGAELVIVDSLGSGDLKWRNIAKRRLVDLLPPNDGLAFLDANRSKIDGVVHMGAISTTTETDVDAIVRNNFRLSVDLWQFCAAASIPFVYASSAATYGDGRQGFEDRFDAGYLASLRPLNPYGWSKHLFDRFVQHRVASGAPCPPRWAGLKLFNVYGPNEYHKEGQRSVAVQLHEQIRSRGSVRLFRSDDPDYADGEQLRDFVWVGDCVEVTRWLLEDANAPSGLYNVGSGAARSFRELAEIIFRELNMERRIDYIDLPENLVGKYQYFTCASLDRLRAAGYARPMTSLEEGLHLYVRSYLEAEDRFR